MSWEREDGLLAASVGLVQLVSLRSLDKYVFHDRLLTVLAAAALGTTMFLLAPRDRRCAIGSWGRPASESGR